ncbi:hypothetical protein [Candidatus Poriferisodalis sp.]|uniref:hypothetical protein n=1 Tax=Candidatus Poriferisodalis sp. TaxID=3101277 RepID=UPI003AF5B9E6
MSASVSRRWLGAAVIALCLTASCASDQPDAGPAGVAPTIAASTSTAAPHESTPVAATSTTQSDSATTDASAPAPSTAPPDSAASDTEDDPAHASDLATLVDFRHDNDDSDAEGPVEYVVGRDIAPGVWQWSQLSAGSCIFVAVAPEPWSSGPGEPQRPIYQDDVERLWWLDARDPVALASGEAVIGYNSSANIDGMISATSRPECFLERTGDHSVPDEETYARRHDSGSGGVEGGDDIPAEEPESAGEFEGDTSWECRAHSGPEPVDLLDWRDEPGTQHPEVSCVVGEGILAGWWQWHELSATDCIFVVVDSGDEVDRHLHPSQSRRDAREPILLREGEIVEGYSESGNTGSSFTAGISHPSCFLEHIAPEDEFSA